MGGEDWNPSTVKELKQSKLYLFRLYLRKIGLIPLLIILYVAIGLAIFK